MALMASIMADPEPFRWIGYLKSRDWKQIAIAPYLADAGVRSFELGSLS